MENLREPGISLDNGGPFVIWDEEHSDELKKGAVVDTLICSNPSCRAVHIVAMYIDERFQDITMKGNKLSYKVTGGNREQLPDPLKRSSFSLDFDTNEIVQGEETSNTHDDPELFAWLSKRLLSDEYLKILKRRWRILKKENDDQWQKEDWSWWSPGEKIPYHKAFPESFSFIVICNRKQFLVNDYYCVTPGCQCRDITLSIMNYGKNLIEAGGSIEIDCQTLKPINFDSISINRNTLQDIWKEFRKTGDLKTTLLERRKRMKSIGKELFEMRNVDTQVQPIKSIRKTGRNQPCPCGSGKKYKKCCLNIDSA